MTRRQMFLRYLSLAREAHADAIRWQYSWRENGFSRHCEEEMADCFSMARGYLNSARMYREPRVARSYRKTSELLKEALQRSLEMSAIRRVA